MRIHPPQPTPPQPSKGRQRSAQPALSPHKTQTRRSATEPLRRHAIYGLNPSGLSPRVMEIAMSDSPVSAHSFFEALDEGLTITLGLRHSDGLDLQDAMGTQSALRRHLTRAFQEVLDTAFAGQRENPEAIASATIRQLAAIRAELAICKAALAERPGEADLKIGYDDPLALARRIVAAGAEAPIIGPQEAAFPFDARILCAGWGPVETQPDGTRLRWMGPEPQGALVLPAFGAGRHRIDLACRWPDADQPANLQVAAPGALECNLIASGPSGIALETVLPEGQIQGFQYIDLALPAGLARIEMETGEVLMRGPGVMSITVRRTAGVEAAG